jgi:N,N-dimethylformamidase
VGFTAAGIKGGAAYEVIADASDPRTQFVFRGVDVAEPLGAFGPMGGAAGDELDRADAELGTPLEAIVLASSQGRHDDLYQGTLEDTPEMSPEQGGTTNPRVRSDMVLMETARGGMVFSVGSIAWCLCLSVNGDDNSVSRITDNVLRRFLSEDGGAESDDHVLGETSASGRS